jgi:nucleoside-diphosphate-sugar epimerase
MTTKKTALVLGATGGIGGAIGAALDRHGWTVRALVRDPARVASAWSRGGRPPAFMAGDAMVRADVVAAAEGVDAIVHAVNPPGYRNWEATVLPMIENTIAAARMAGGARVVLPGTIYNFDPAQTPRIDAGTPQNPRTRKGAIRVRLERLLEEAAPAVPSLVVRAGDFFGPGARASWFAQALVKPGRPVRRLFNPAVGAGHSWAYLPDLAKAIVRLMDSADLLAAFERVQFEGYCDGSGTGMTDAVRRAVGRDVPEKPFPWWLMRLLAPFGGFPREVVEIEPYWRHPVRLDNRRLVALLGQEPRTPLDAAVRATLSALGCLDRSAAVSVAQSG